MHAEGPQVQESRRGCTPRQPFLLQVYRAMVALTPVAIKVQTLAVLWCTDWGTHGTAAAGVSL